MAASDTGITRDSSYAELGLAISLVGIVILMVLPMPAPLLDLSLVFSLALSLTILVVALQIRDPLDFSAFPSVLLFATLLRLGLNVASTRLILLRGEEGSAAAGRLIEAFGQFVVGGNYAIGFIVFLILTLINFLVITKGATRIAEVAARFALDGMPGKQMAIDADLNAGLINGAEARHRRECVQKEADFYGAMDGASKFVRGDAIAGLIILAVNLLGGFFTGVAQKGFSVAKSAEIYSLLSVGDGLVTQIPALIVSTGAGMVVTRAASGVELGAELKSQILARPQILRVVAGVLAAFALVPGFPAIPFLLAAATAGGVSYRRRQRDAVSPGRAQAAKLETVAEPLRPVPLDLLELEVGYELIPLVDGEKGGLVERIRALRRQFVTEKGFLVPQIHIRDNLRLGSKAYAILLKGVEVGRGELRPGKLLAMNAAQGTGSPGGELLGEETREPAFGLAAVWIPLADRERAEILGYTVVDPETVLITHLSELVKRHAPELLTRQGVQELLDGVGHEHPKMLEELMPQHLSLGGVQKVLQNLLREEVPIRDLVTIIETLADHAPQTKDPEELTEAVRQALSRTISYSYRNPEGVIPLMTVDPQIEREIREKVQERAAIDPQSARRIIGSAQQAMENFASRGAMPVFLTIPAVRRHLRQLLGRYLPQIIVLSHNEIADGVRIQSLGVMRWNDEN
ncbi:MAG: flagellar biosynthesis protein FlhA [Deltaproteobacteria bacterium]|nr:flagellar biosynthesis protein FlhA [Deltaproteobacteria bacterium]